VGLPVGDGVLALGRRALDREEGVGEVHACFLGVDTNP
jgi:hypothetical protein